MRNAYDSWKPLSERRWFGSGVRKHVDRIDSLSVIRGYVHNFTHPGVGGSAARGSPASECG